MKKTGICPKCNSKEVYTNRENNIYSKNRYEIAGGSGTSSLRIDAYLCISCGFLEEYVRRDSLSNERKMTKMKKKWVQV